MPPDTLAITYTTTNGTVFSSTHADLRNKVRISKFRGEAFAQLAEDVTEFVAWHAMNVYPSLNGFSGYDTVQYDTSEFE